MKVMQYSMMLTNFILQSYYKKMYNSQRTASGKFKMFFNLNTNLQYGIYRIHIEGLPKKNAAQCSQLFRYNQEEYYTHFDIEIARKGEITIYLSQCLCL